VASRSVLAVSLLFHGALGTLVYQIEKDEAHAATAIEMAESKKKEEAAKPEPPPPPPPPKHAPRRAAAQEKAAEAPPPEAAPLEALPDFGLELSGGIGGLAVAPAAGATAATPTKAPPTARAAAQAVKRPTTTAAATDDCDEPPAKPKPRNIPQPAYTDAAREAGVEGKVRVELTVDETGRVVNVRVIAGLGHGLDEAAVAAVRDATFEPAIRCGKPSQSTFTLGIRFSAG
jgi:periplasmic protein TonB